MGGKSDQEGDIIYVRIRYIWGPPLPHIGEIFYGSELEEDPMAAREGGVVSIRYILQSLSPHLDKIEMAGSQGGS